MFKEYVSQNQKNAGRQLVLAENYRLSPIYKKQPRESVYDAPMRIIRDVTESAGNSDRKEIRSSVLSALTKWDH